MSVPKECLINTQCPYIAPTQIVGGRCDGLRGVLFHSPGMPMPVFLTIAAAHLTAEALAMAVDELRHKPSDPLPESWDDEPEPPEVDPHGN